MPTYEYLCNQCEHAFEAIQTFSEAALEVCPKCNGVVRKVYNNVGVVFKGSGFYKTDSRSSPAKKTEPTATKAEPKPVAKVESKPVKKSTD